jgi:hypothetical protein
LKALVDALPALMHLRSFDDDHRDPPARSLDDTSPPSRSNR